jgi:hypothetical protein
MARHNARDGLGRFAPVSAGDPPRAKHVTSAHKGAQIRPRTPTGRTGRTRSSAVSLSAPYTGNPPPGCDHTTGPL